MRHRSKNICLCFWVGLAWLPLASLAVDEGDDSNEATAFSDMWESASETIDSEDVTARLRVEDIVEPPNEYRYASFGRGDPFLPPYIQMVVGQEALVRSYEVPIVSGLQVPLDQLKVEGIWTLDNHEMRALIRTQARNEGIIAKVGDPIGLAGKIVEIKKEMIVARLYNLHEDGSRTFEDKILFLGDPSDFKRLHSRRRVILRPGENAAIEEDESLVVPSATMPELTRPAGRIQPGIADGENHRNLKSSK